MEEPFDTTKYWKDKYNTLLVEHKKLIELYNGTPEERIERDLTDIKIYKITNPIVKIKACKKLSDSGNFNLRAAKKYGIEGYEWSILTAFINSTMPEKKDYFYKKMNNGEFII